MFIKKTVSSLALYLQFHEQIHLKKNERFIYKKPCETQQAAEAAAAAQQQFFLSYYLVTSIHFLAYLLVFLIRAFAFGACITFEDCTAVVYTPAP